MTEIQNSNIKVVRHNLSENFKIRGTERDISKRVPDGEFVSTGETTNIKWYMAYKKNLKYLTFGDTGRFDEVNISKLVRYRARFESPNNRQH